MGAEWALVAVGIVTLVFGVINYLLSAKDAAQAIEIADFKAWRERHTEKQHQLEVELQKRIHQDEFKDTVGKIFTEFKEIRSMFYGQERRKQEDNGQ